MLSKEPVFNESVSKHIFDNRTKENEMKNFLILITGILFLLVLNCNQTPFTKLNDELVSGKDAKTALLLYLAPTDDPYTLFVYRPVYIKITTGIDDSSYYSRKSVDKCKENISLLRFLHNTTIVLANCKFQKAGFIQSGATRIL